ncbi:MAG: hypothetical protein AAGA56_21860 [Myxococcota bacterium]
MAWLPALSLVLAQASASTAAAPHPEPIDLKPIFGWSAVGVGAAATVAGIVMGGIAWSRYDNLDCQNDICLPDDHDAAQRYNDLRIPSGLLIVGGLATVGLGLPFLLVDSDRAEQTTLRVGPGSLTLSGRL